MKIIILILSALIVLVCGFNIDRSTTTDYKDNGRYVVESNGRVFDTRTGGYVVQLTERQKYRENLDRNRSNGYKQFGIIIAVLVGGPLAIIWSVGRSRLGRQKEKDIDLGATMLADYPTFESFEATYPEFHKLSDQVKDQIRKFYHKH